jgi:hypothetical protein
MLRIHREEGGHAHSLTPSADTGDHRRAASVRRRATLLITATFTAFLAPFSPRARAEELDARRLRAAALPSLHLGAAFARSDVAGRGLYSVEAYARLSWPLDSIRRVARDPAPQKAAAHDRLLTRMIELRRRREALAAQPDSLERALDLEEADAELDAVEAGELR